MHECHVQTTILNAIINDLIKISYSGVFDFDANLRLDKCSCIWKFTFLLKLCSLIMLWYAYASSAEVNEYAFANWSEYA